MSFNFNLFLLLNIVHLFSSGLCVDITVVNKDGINAYWYAVYLEDVAGAASVTQVSILDSSGDTGWTVGVSSAYGFWSWQSYTNGWVVPFSMRIVNSDGETIEKTDVIRDINEHSEFDFMDNFDPNSEVNTDIELTNKDGINEYWHAFYVSNVNINAGAITNVEMIDSSAGAVWTEPVDTDEGDLGTFYAFQNNDGWELPYSVQITNCVGDVLISDENVITHRVAFGLFDFGSNFQDSECPPTPVPVMSNNIKVTKVQGYNPWWVALEITNVSPGTEISSVQLQDGGSAAFYIPGTFNNWGALQVWTFESNDQGGQFELPFSLRITDTLGNVKEQTDLVTGWEDSAVYDFGDNF